MANSWWEIQVLCAPGLEESLFWRLESFGCHGTASSQKELTSLVTAYLPQEDAHLLDLAALSLRLRQDALCLNLPPPVMQWGLIDEEDWASSWKQHWKPQEIGDRFLIYPAWLTVPERSERLVLRLEPGAAFGTGDHATTQLCLESLEMRLAEDPSEMVLADIGCGSGILSVGALQLGAKQVYAVDVDSQAVKATRANRALNHIAPERLVVKKGSVGTLKSMVSEPVDGILCNILAEVIIDLIPEMTELAKPTTWGVLSGILLDQAKTVANSMEAYGWVVAALWKRQDWCCLNVRRS